jgi:multidrug efflux pump subunit AcrA (membrane-fusion protein)
MFSKFILPCLSMAMLTVTVAYVQPAPHSQATTPPPIPPSRSPFEEAVAAIGTVEAQTENIAVGTPVSGVVAEVYIGVGQHVAAGQALLRLDDRQLQAELKVREAALSLAEAEMAQLKAQPRPEQLPALEARIRYAQAELAEQEDNFQRMQKLHPHGASSDGELMHVRQKRARAREALAAAQAECDLVRLGAWKPELAVAQKKIAYAEAERERVQTELHRLIIRAPGESQVLQVNARPGEYLAAPSPQPALVLGNVQKLHVRVEVDGFDIPRFQPGAPAFALVPGRSEQRIPLSFVRIEPFVVSKTTLRGQGAERIDTRVLQVIYAVDADAASLFVGQQVDVFVAADPTPVSDDLRLASES